MANNGGNPKKALTNRTGMVKAGRSKSTVNRAPAAFNGPANLPTRSRTKETGRFPRTARLRLRCSEAALTHSRTRSDRKTPAPPERSRSSPPSAPPPPSTPPRPANTPPPPPPPPHTAQQEQQAKTPTPTHSQT
nr:hypothetical protein GCM10025732_49410 [Glycomyces mayteni]